MPKTTSLAGHPTYCVHSLIPSMRSGLPRIGREYRTLARSFSDRGQSVTAFQLLSAKQVKLPLIGPCVDGDVEYMLLLAAAFSFPMQKPYDSMGFGDHNAFCIICCKMHH